MDVKIFELRDAATFVPVMCVKLAPRTEEERYLLGRTGYGTSPVDQSQYVLMLGLAGGEGHYDCDPYGWGSNRTRQIAHKHIIAHWHNLATGAVIDVEYLLNESLNPKHSERVDGI